jgi:hypothetical protein
LLVVSEVTAVVGPGAAVVVGPGTLAVAVVGLGAAVNIGPGAPVAVVGLGVAVVVGLVAPVAVVELGAVVVEGVGTGVSRVGTAVVVASGTGREVYQVTLNAAQSMRMKHWSAVVEEAYTCSRDARMSSASTARQFVLGLPYTVRVGVVDHGVVFLMSCDSAVPLRISCTCVSTIVVDRAHHFVTANVMPTMNASMLNVGLKFSSNSPPPATPAAYVRFSSPPHAPAVQPGDVEVRRPTLVTVAAVANKKCAHNIYRATIFTADDLLRTTDFKFGPMDNESILQTAADANSAEAALALFRGDGLFEAARRGAQYALAAGRWDALSYYADFLRDVSQGDMTFTSDSETDAKDSTGRAAEVSLAEFVVPV